MQFIIYAPVKVKKRMFLIVMLLVILTCLVLYRIYYRTQNTVSPLPLTGIVIAVDPGHGGYDPGVFKEELVEKEITLQIALSLRGFLQQGGATVIMTRETDKDYATMPTGPLKQRDLSERLKIISEARHLDALISIHLNSFPAPVYRGAQTFYSEESGEESKLLASLIQEELIRVLQNTNRGIKTGDFYLLKHAPCPAVIVEAGFLTNPEEASLLSTPEYQKKIAWAIYLGTIRFVKNNM